MVAPLPELFAGGRDAGGTVVGTSVAGMVMVWPQNLHGPDWPANWSATVVCLPQCGQVNEMGMEFRLSFGSSNFG